MATPIPVTATPFAGTPRTDTVSRESLHQTLRPRWSACKTHAPSSVPVSGTVDNARDGLALDHRAVPCTAGLNRSAGVASASDPHGITLAEPCLLHGSDPDCQTCSTELSPHLA